MATTSSSKPLLGTDEAARAWSGAPDLRWIVVGDTHHILPIGSYSGHVQLRQEADGTWRLDHTAVAGTEQIGHGLTFARAQQFAERYVTAAYYDISLTALDAGWRDDPMNERQHGRLLLLMGVVEIYPTLTRGQASDLFHKVKAQRALAAAEGASQ